MLDDVWKPETLLMILEDHAPFEAQVTPRLASSLTKQVPGLKPFDRCVIEEAHYAGDAGGIMCLLAFPDRETEGVVVCSITHLAFDRRLPFAREIAQYQKHRVKRMRREFGRDLAMTGFELDC
jgi:hypothetical protein